MDAFQIGALSKSKKARSPFKADEAINSFTFIPNLCKLGHKSSTLPEENNHFFKKKAFGKVTWVTLNTFCFFVKVYNLFRVRRNCNQDWEYFVKYNMCSKERAATETSVHHIFTLFTGGKFFSRRTHRREVGRERVSTETNLKVEKARGWEKLHMFRRKPEWRARRQDKSFFLLEIKIKQHIL